MTRADRVAAAYARSMRRYAARGPGRVARDVAGLAVVSLGLPERWANVVLALDRAPEAGAVDEALAWFVARGVDAEVLVRQRDVERLGHLDRVDEMPVLIAPAEGEQGLLEVAPAATAAEFVEVYRAAFAMRPGLAEALVVDADLGLGGMVHLVGRRDGATVACALLRPDGDLAYLSAVGVVPARQGQGFGRAMLAAAAAQARDRGCASVWLHAAGSTRGFYESVGYTWVDTHVALA